MAETSANSFSYSNEQSTVKVLDTPPVSIKEKTPFMRQLLVIFGGLQFSFGIVTILATIVTIICLVKNSKLPDEPGLNFTGTLFGFIYCLTGVISIVAGKKKHIFPLVICMIMCVICCLLSLINLIISILLLNAENENVRSFVNSWNITGFKVFYDRFDSKEIQQIWRSMHIVLSIFSVMEFITAITTSALSCRRVCCCYGKRYRRISQISNKSSEERIENSTPTIIYNRRPSPDRC